MKNTIIFILIVFILLIISRDKEVIYKQEIYYVPYTQDYYSQEREIFVNITAYTSIPRCTDSTPFITAFNTRVRKGIIAVSRDIEATCKLKQGQKIYATSVGEVVFEDRMGKTSHGKPLTQTIDVWLPTEQEALQFGRKKGIIIIKGKI